MIFYLTDIGDFGLMKTLIFYEEFYMRTYYWDRFRVHQRAKRDARLGIPPAEWDGNNGNVSFTEQGLETACNSDINDIHQKWKKAENKILNELVTLVPSAKGSADRYTAKLKAYKEKYGKDAGPDPKVGHSFWTILFIFVCAAIEASLNAAAFRMLRDSAFNTWMIALSLSISIVFLAHHWGKLLKSRDKVLFENVSTIGIPIVVILIAYFVGMARMNSAIMREIDESSIKLSFAIFIIVNLVAFLITVFTSYKHSPIYPRLQQPFKQYKKRRRHYYDRIESLKSNLTEAISRIKDKIMLAEFYRQEYQRMNQLVRTELGTQSPVYFSDKKSWQIIADIPAELNKYITAPRPTEEYMEDLGKNNKAIVDLKQILGKVEG